MRAWLALLTLGAGLWIGIGMSDPVFDAAAEHLCTTHSEENGLRLLEASGSLAHNGDRPWTAMRFSYYHCVFEDASGDRVFLDQFDEELKRTWDSRGLRLAGWLVAVGPGIAAVAAAGATGMLKRDREGAGERT